MVRRVYNRSCLWEWWLKKQTFVWRYRHTYPYPRQPYWTVRGAAQRALKDQRRKPFKRKRNTRIKIKSRKKLKKRTKDRRISHTKWKARYAQRMLRREVTFKQFNNLPTELRLQVWEQYALTPRIVKIFDLLEFGLYGHGHTIKIDGVLRRQVCPLLLVNRESRYSALREPLILFGLSQSNFPAYRSILRFAIRPHDIVYFDEQISHDIALVEGDSKDIRNLIMLDELPGGYLDLMVSRDSLESQARHFLEYMDSRISLIMKLGNMHHIERVYRLLVEPRAVLHRRWEWDDIREDTPDLIQQQKLFQPLVHKFLGIYERHTEAVEFLKGWKTIRLS